MLTGASSIKVSTARSILAQRTIPRQGYSLAQAANKGAQSHPHTCQERRTIAHAAGSMESTKQASAVTPVMSGQDIRKAFLDFYAARGHTVLPSSSLVPEDPTVLLTIAGMLQFKPIFLGQRPRGVPKATTTQKCIRTNDIENVGVTARHHTFFEMLGNFSFGDYFKEDACKWAWQLATEVYRLPPERVFVSVFEEDDEAFALWRDIVGVPEERIKRMGAEDNFWASGATGPCGPCSELYYDLHPERGLDEAIDLDDDSRFIEFYNLVFMELNRDASGELTPLANKNIDTGMGLERMAQILQGVPNNYETDLIQPIMDVAADLAGIKYATADEPTKTSLKVIADHTRAVVYLLSDGVIPSNVGRGYVVRRLLRRVVLKGRLLGLRKPFVAAVAQAAVKLSGGCDPAVQGNWEKMVQEEISREEARFTATIAAGEGVLEKLMTKAKSEGGVMKGADAFLMYDTYGFPLELTQEVAADSGLTVDEEGFHEAMEEQRTRSKDAREEVDLTADSALSELASQAGATEFTGYEDLRLDSVAVLQLLKGGAAVESCSKGDKVDVLLPRTPFYAESGGQVGDIGTLEASSGAVLKVQDVKKAAGGQLFVHHCTVDSGSMDTGATVHAAVDERFRRRTRAHHTATHLLQAALKQVLGDNVAQQGSQVSDEGLRFDLNLPRGMTPEEISEVEALVNTWIEEAHPLQTTVMDLNEAKAAGATAMFGEKYDNEVRVVDVPGVSMELCGGTHVQNTAEIGGFKITAELGIASGIRRVEAKAGPALIPYLNEVDAVASSLAGKLKVGVDGIVGRVDGLLKEVSAQDKTITALRAELAVAKAASLAGDAEDVNGSKVLVARLEDVDGGALAKAAGAISEALGDPSAVVLASAPAGGGKVVIVTSFSETLVKEKKMNAGKFVGGLAKICGGGGGGKPGLAQAGGRNAEKLPEALEEAKTQLHDALST